MCTVTFFPNQEDGYILAMNRDEQRTRLEATQVKHSLAGDAQTSYPVDPLAGGTWIGCNERGILFTLLNRPTCDSVDFQGAKTSRGLIIPELLKQGGLLDIVQSIQEIDARRYAPFTLALYDPNTKKVVIAESDGKSCQLKTHPWAPLFLTSSSINSQKVCEYRKGLFNDLLVSTPVVGREKLLRFHLTQAAGQEAESILMSRDDARTVSLSIAEFANGKMELSYASLPENSRGTAAGRRLEFVS